MPRLLSPLVAATGMLLVACGSSSSTSDSPVVTPPSSIPAGHSASPSTSSGGSAAPGATGSAGATATAAPASASPTASSAAAGGQPSSAPGQVPLPPPGTYTYRFNGSSTSALGTQNQHGDSTLTVDQPQGNREHSTQRDSSGSTEQVLVARSSGLYLAEIHLTQPGFDEDFKAKTPALLFPASAHKGQRWHWQMTSTDGNYTLTAQLTVRDLHSSATTADGTRVNTVSISSVLHLKSKDIDLTIHQSDESGRDAVIVREHSTTDGTAYGTPFHAKATRVLASRSN